MTPTNAVQTAESNHEAWIPLLELATREVFELMLNSQLTKPEATMEESTDITSMVGLAGALCGLLSVRCSRPAAELMASKMLGVSPDKVGADLCDAFGDICNMVAGNFKNKISGLSDGCMLSVPTVVTGNDYTLHPLTELAGIEVRFVFEGQMVVTTLQVNN